MSAPAGYPVHAAPGALLIVGGEDREALRLARAGGHEIAVVAGASRTFREPGALEQVAHLAAAWFAQRFVAERDSGLVPDVAASAAA